MRGGGGILYPIGAVVVIIVILNALGPSRAPRRGR
jgi:hypothetical protein